MGFWHLENEQHILKYICNESKLGFSKKNITTIDNQEEIKMFKMMYSGLMITSNAI